MNNMRNKIHWTVISLFVVILSVCLFAFIGQKTSADEAVSEPFEPLPEGRTLVTPPNESVLLGSQIGMIVRGQFDELYLDDEEISFSKRIQSKSASFAVLNVSPGRHYVYMSAKDGREEEFEFVVAVNENEHNGPRSWKRFYQHQFERVSNPCANCHLVQKAGDKVEVGHWKSVQESCAKCHVEQKRLKLEEFHKDVKSKGWDDSNWIESCTDCHYVHQGETRMLLREKQIKGSSDKLAPVR